MNEALTTVVTNASSLEIGSKGFAYCASLRNFISCSNRQVVGTDVFTGTEIIFVDTVSKYPSDKFAEKSAVKTMRGCLVFPTSHFTVGHVINAAPVEILSQLILSSNFDKRIKIL